jgi:hypothetical protein
VFNVYALVKRSQIGAGNPQIVAIKSTQFPESSFRWKHFTNQFLVDVKMKTSWEPINSVNVEIG